MAGMPDPIEDSTSTGGAGRFFWSAESWLNVPDPMQRRSRRNQALASVMNFAGISSATTLSPGASGGVSHFNQHWRGGPAGWWHRITPARVNSEMQRAFVAALNQDLDIRLRWNCTNRDLNALEYFWATPHVEGDKFWIDILSPRTPDGIDPASDRPNYGFNAISDLMPGSIGPFTVLGDREVANYDGTDGVDTSFDNDLGQMVTTEGFRESWSFFPIPEPVENGPQVLTGLSYTRDSWRPLPDQDGAYEDVPLHSETGYLLWDARNNLAYRVIALPRGVTLLAVASGVEEVSDELTFEANADADDALLGGILSNPILSGSVRTVRFTSTMQIGTDGSSFTYEEAVEQRRDDQEVRHTDSNSLIRI